MSDSHLITTPALIMNSKACAVLWTEIRRLLTAEGERGGGRTRRAELQEILDGLAHGAGMSVTDGHALRTSTDVAAGSNGEPPETYSSREAAALFARPGETCTTRHANRLLHARKIEPLNPDGRRYRWPGQEVRALAAAR